ncbi:helix-turn-helix domain-containing protein [Phenylobacterium sp. J367]|uniref:helix-turn-helix domain-containing protein n=1 Tax=Phenylobacterium sp. J367 TaxID=2898435 RepID=UPI00215156C5|nr:helix-turn-helix transcriptional regulator [Phenylobacterium sp. J367]MCR5877218.1 helix-turn-helix domain-containing protein [Phenylobacterium sp. J367]
MGVPLAWSRRPNPVFGDEYAELREVLKAARVAAGLSHRSLARRIGKHASHISKIESGQRRVDVLDLYRIAKAVEVAPEALFRQIAGRSDAISESGAEA